MVFVDNNYRRRGEYQRVGSFFCFVQLFYYIYIWDWKEYNKRNIILRNKYFSLNVFLHERIWIDIIYDTFRICSRKNIFLFICERRWFLFIEFIFRKEYFDMNLGYMRFQQLTLYMILIWISIEFNSTLLYPGSHIITNMDNFRNQRCNFMSGYRVVIYEIRKEKKCGPSIDHCGISNTHSQYRHLLGISLSLFNYWKQKSK